MINLIAIFTIVKFRIKEFTSEYHYSILAPLTSNLLFVIIFSNSVSFELSTIILAKIDLVDGSILELMESISPRKVFSNAEFIISALRPGFKIPVC